MTTPPRLLIVEDDPGLQTQLKWCFDDYEVLLAGDREEALAQLRRHAPPVVLQDFGGDVRVTSAPAAGTTFTLRFPIESLTESGA